MIARCLTVSAGLLAVLMLSPSAYAVDQLPLPNPQVSTSTAEIREFASATVKAPSVQACANILKNNTEDKVRAIREYRQCRADRALQQLAVWKWQDSFN